MGLFATRVKSRMKANKNMHAKKYDVEQRRCIVTFGERTVSW